MADRTFGGLIRQSTDTSTGAVYVPQSQRAQAAIAAATPGDAERILRNETLAGVSGQRLQNAIRASNFLARNGGRAFGIQVEIDLKRLAAALNDVDITGKTHTTGIYRALNHTIDKVNTQLKRMLVQWSGANRQKPVLEALSKRYANSGHLVAAIVIKDKWAVITSANYSARFRSGPGGGVSHNAWGRSQFAAGAFMLPGKAPAFKHASHPAKHRGDLVPLYGPNYAREAERHQGEVREMLQRFAQVEFIPRAVHEVRREFERVKAKHGL